MPPEQPARTEYLISSQRKLLLLAVILVIGIAAACASKSPEQAVTVPTPPDASPSVAVATSTPTPLSYVTTQPANGQKSSLRCEECRAVEVVEVTGPETVVTADGPVRLYGVFVAPEEENCVSEATDRLAELVGATVRLEEGSLATDSAGTLIRYVYSESGDSIDELFISEGLARTSAFDGAHAPWLLITADKARRARSGCIWGNYDRLFPQRTPRPSGGIN